MNNILTSQQASSSIQPQYENYVDITKLTWDLRIKSHYKAIPVYNGKVGKHLPHPCNLATQKWVYGKGLPRALTLMLPGSAQLRGEGNRGGTRGRRGVELEVSHAQEGRTTWF